MPTQASLAQHWTAVKWIFMIQRWITPLLNRNAKYIENQPKKKKTERKIGNELSDGIDILVELMAKRVVH